MDGGARPVPSLHPNNIITGRGWIKMKEIWKDVYNFEGLYMINRGPFYPGQTIKRK